MGRAFRMGDFSQSIGSLRKWKEGVSGIRFLTGHPVNDGGSKPQTEREQTTIGFARGVQSNTERV